MIDQRLYYFSRKTPPDRLASRYLVSGLIQAPSLDEARGQLAFALVKASTSVNEFDFTEVKVGQRPPQRKDQKETPQP